MPERYQVLVGPPGSHGYRPGDLTLPVIADSDLGAAYQAGLALSTSHVPVGRARSWTVKAVLPETGPGDPEPGDHAGDSEPCTICGTPMTPGTVLCLVCDQSVQS